MEKKLKIALCIIVIILISIISFAGIYLKNDAVFKSKLPNYVLGTELGGKRITKLQVTTGTEEVIYDKDGNKVDSIPDGANEADYRKEQEKINKDELFTKENYKKVKEIFEGRLKELGIQEYLVRLNEETGEVIVELEESINTDTVLQYLLCTGDFALSDSKDKTVLLDKSNVEQAKVVYSRGTSSGVSVYLDIIFDKEGKDKLAQISRDYIKVEETNSEENKDENTENQDNAENTENNNDDNNTENSTENSEDKKESNQKQVTLTLEGMDMLTTAFGEEMLNGELPISLGSATDNSALQEYAEQGRFYAMLLNNDTMPLQYEMGTTETVRAEAGGQNLYILVGIIAVMTILIIAFMIYKFKLDGVFAGVSIIGTVAMLLLMLRYTRTEISLNAIFGVLAIIMLDAYLICKMLVNIKKNSEYENVRKTIFKTYLENIEVIIISLILAVIFTFMQYVKVYSLGMTLFYGIISIGLTNVVFLRTMLLTKYSNK